MTSEERISRYSQKLNSLSKILNKKYPNLKNKELDKFLHYEHAFMMVFRVIDNCMKKKRFLGFNAITNFFSKISRKIEIIKKLLKIFHEKKDQVLKQHMKRWRKKCTFKCGRNEEFRKKINLVFFIRNIDFLKSSFYKLRIFSLLKQIKEYDNKNKTEIKNLSEKFSRLREELFILKLSETLNKKFNNPISSARAFYRMKEFSVRKFDLLWVLCDNLENARKRMLLNFFVKCQILKFAEKKMTKLFKTIDQQILKEKERGFQRIHVFSNFNRGLKYVSPKNIRIKFFTKILDKILKQHKQQLHGSFIEKILDKKKDKTILMSLIKIFKKLKERLLNNSFNQLKLIAQSNELTKNTGNKHKRGFEKIFRLFSQNVAFKKMKFLYNLKFHTKFYSKNQKNANILNLMIERILKNRKIYAFKNIRFLLASRWEKGKALYKNLKNIYMRKMQRSMSILYGYNNTGQKKKINFYRNQFLKMIAILGKLLILKIKGETFNKLKIFDSNKGLNNVIVIDKGKEQSLGLRSLFAVIKSSLKTLKSQAFNNLKIDKHNKTFFSKEKIRSSLSLIKILDKFNNKNFMHFLKKLKNYHQDHFLFQNKIKKFMNTISNKVKHSKKYLFSAFEDKKRKISSEIVAAKTINKILKKWMNKKALYFFEIISRNCVIDRKINEFHKKTISINNLEILLSNHLSRNILETFDTLKLKSDKFEYGVYLFKSFNESIQEKLMRESFFNLRTFNNDRTDKVDEPNIFTKIHDELKIVLILTKNNRILFN